MAPSSSSVASTGSGLQYLILILLSFGVLWNMSNRPSVTSLALGTFEAREPYVYKLNDFYSASRVERYAMEHAVDLKLHDTKPLPYGCSMWRDSERTIHPYLRNYLQEQTLYVSKLKAFKKAPYDDLRPHLGHNHSVCDGLEVHPYGMGGVFASGSLSRMPQGLLEPVFPPLRDPMFCYNSRMMMSRDYLVHDFATYCRDLKPATKSIFLDIGISLDKTSVSTSTSHLVDLYAKFGFPMDSINVYTSTTGGHTPKLASNYKVIKGPIDTDPNSDKYPFKVLLKDYSEDDFVIVKLNQVDGDPAQTFDLAKQLLTNKALAQRIDAFYLEHGVSVMEVYQKQTTSQKTMSTTSVREILQLVSGLRYQGIPTHLWV